MQEKPPPVEVGIMHPTPKPPEKPHVNPIATIAAVLIVGMFCATILGVVSIIWGH